MEFFKANFPEGSALKFLYVILIYTISLSPKLGTIMGGSRKKKTGRLEDMEFPGVSKK